MQVAILGSAAGGGFPQWNCSCRNCRSSRAGTFLGKSRTQTQVAVSNGGKSWFLLNASPDLRLQIEATRTLHPPSAIRSSPISGVVLTGGDLDQIAGLLSLRELQPFRLYCTPSVRRILQDDNSVFAMLNRLPDQVVWTEIKLGETASLRTAAGQDSGLRYEAFSVGTRYPAYVKPERTACLTSEEAVLGLVVESSSGKRLAYLPSVAQIDDALLQRMKAADVVLFDGTFWDDDELIQVQGNGATAREMGHIPVSDSLARLSELNGPRKLFVHVNNTNPMLDESSPEREQVRAAGWEVAEDGWKLDL